MWRGLPQSATLNYQSTINNAPWDNYCSGHVFSVVVGTALRRPRRVQRRNPLFWGTLYGTSLRPLPRGRGSRIRGTARCPYHAKQMRFRGAAGETPAATGSWSADISEMHRV